MVSSVHGAYKSSLLITLQLIFVSLTNILLITSLISLLSNSLSKVRTHERDVGWIILVRSNAAHACQDLEAASHTNTASFPSVLRAFRHTAFMLYVYPGLCRQGSGSHLFQIARLFRAIVVQRRIRARLEDCSLRLQ